MTTATGKRRTGRHVVLTPSTHLSPLSRVTTWEVRLHVGRGRIETLPIRLADRRRICGKRRRIVQKRVADLAGLFWGKSERQHIGSLELSNVPATPHQPCLRVRAPGQHQMGDLVCHHESQKVVLVHRGSCRRNSHAVVYRVRDPSHAFVWYRRKAERGLRDVTTRRHLRRQDDERHLCDRY